MTTPNSQFSERAAIVAALPPQAVEDAVVNTSYADMSRFGRVAFLLSVGGVDPTATIDAALYQATDAEGSGAVLIAGKAIQQMNADDAQKHAVIELRGTEMGAGFTHAACRVSVGTAEATVSVLAIGIDARSEPAHAHDLASVAQIVA